MKWRNRVHLIDDYIIVFLRQVQVPIARTVLFITFFWFGLLKLFYLSPANTLVEELLVKTLPFFAFHDFIVYLGAFEMFIGIIFLIPHFEKLAIAILIPHMITTFGPLVLLPDATWSGLLQPTLEGQYIIKNIVIIGLGIAVAIHAHVDRRALQWRKQKHTHT